MKKFKISTVAAIAVYAMLAAGLSSCGESNKIAVEPFVIYKTEQSTDDAKRNVYHYRSVNFKERTGEFVSYSKYNIGDTLSFHPCR